MKTGDKVMFDTYIPKDHISGRMLRNSIGEIKIKFRCTSYHVKREPYETKFITSMHTEDKPLEGIFIGSFHKKLVRRYKRSDRIVDNSIAGRSGLRFATRREDPFEADDEVRSTPVVRDPYGDITKYSTNPNRIDNPRQLDKMALVSIAKKIIAVPMANIYKCNYSNLFRVL